MEQIIKIFENEKFGRIRTITKDGEPWFVIADVCRALEIRNSRMVAGRLDRDEGAVKKRAIKKDCNHP